MWAVNHPGEALPDDPEDDLVVYRTQEVAVTCPITRKEFIDPVKKYVLLQQIFWLNVVVLADTCTKSKLYWRLLMEEDHKDEEEVGKWLVLLQVRFLSVFSFDPKRLCIQSFSGYTRKRQRVGTWNSSFTKEEDTNSTTRFWWRRNGFIKKKNDMYSYKERNLWRRLDKIQSLFLEHSNPLDGTDVQLIATIKYYDAITGISIYLLGKKKKKTCVTFVVVTVHLLHILIQWILSSSIYS